MNKSKLISVALICALGLSVGACVDNDESASVENLRNQKAGQYAALAELSKAQAEATLIAAKAEALVKEAEAASTNQATQESKDKFALALEQLKAEAAQKEAEAIKAEAAARQAIEEEKNAHLTTLYGNYSTELGVLNTLKKDLFDEQVSLIQVQSELTDWKVQKADEILKSKAEIEKQTAIKTSLQALPVNDHAAAVKAQEQNKVAAQGINDRLTAATSVKDKAKKAYEKAVDAVATTPTAKSGEWLINNYFSVVTYETVTPEKDGEFATEGYVTYSVNSSLVKARSIELKELSIMIESQIGKVDGSETGTLYETLKLTKESEADAKKAAEAADATAADRQAYADAIRATQRAQAAIDQAKNDKADALADYDKLNAAAADFTAEGAADYVAAIAAAEAAGIVEIDAIVALNPIADEAAENLALQTILNAVVNGTTNIAEALSGCDVAISAEQLKISQAEGISDKDSAVEHSKELIADFNAKITVQTSVVAEVKARLDAALAE